MTIAPAAPELRPRAASSHSGTLKKTPNATTLTSRYCTHTPSSARLPASIRTSRNGSSRRRSLSTSAAPAASATGASHHSGWPTSDSSSASTLASITANAPIPGRSTSRRTVASETPSSCCGSRGSQRSDSGSATTPTTTLTKKIACQPASATSAPPRTGPSAALEDPAIVIAASVLGGGRCPPDALRSSASPAGKPADVPAASSSRAAISQPKLGASGPSTPATTISRKPAHCTRRGPNWSASRPSTDCPTAATR